MTGSARSTALGGVAVGALVLAAALSPAAFAASVIGDGSFDTGPGAWVSYGLDGPADTGGGKYCGNVAAGSGAYSNGILLNGVAIEAGKDYTLSFAASASIDVAPRALIGQNGAPYGTVLDANPALTSTMTTFTYEFTADKTFPAVAAAGDPEGQIAFQLGGFSPSAWTFCLDDVTLTTGDQAIVEHSFAGGDLAAGAWNMYDNAGGVPTASADGTAVCLPLGGGYTNVWDAGLVYKGVPIVKGGNYALSFRAYVAGSVPSVTVNAKVGEDGGGYRPVGGGEPVLTATPTVFTYPFAAQYDIPGTLTDGVVGRIAFELATVSTPYTFCISDVSLVRTTSAPPVYTPTTGPRVRVNQVGYLPDGPKQATVVTTATAPFTWQLHDASDAVVADGTSTPAGVDASAGTNVQTIDFGAFTGSGTGYTLVADGDTSRPFDISADLYQQLRRDALDYFYVVRSGIDISDTIAPGYGRSAGHVSTPDGAVNKGDKAVTCLTQAEEAATGKDWAYGDWTCPAGFAQDVVGGWYDAGDHGKYVVNGGIAVAQLMSTFERTRYAPSADAAALADGTLAVPEHGDSVPDILNEARWELEFLLSMQVPAGQELGGMAFHKVQDVTWTGVPLDPAADTKARRLHRPSTAATLNLAAAAAQGARLFAPYDPAFATRLRDAATSAWAAAQAHPDLLAPADTATTGNNGGGAYVDPDVSDELYWAAAELYITTGEPQYEQAVLASPHNQTADDATEVFSPGGFSWGSTAAVGRLDLATVPNALPGRTAICQSVLDAADRYVAAQATQPFGTPYVPTGGVYDWGSSSAVLNVDVVVATAFDLTGQARYRDAVLTSMDYLLGRNALNQSYVTGWGEVSSQHQHNRWFPLSATKSSPTGALAGGPNSVASTWDPTMVGTFTEGCAPQMCYLDNVNSWASNEVAINWNSVLSWVSSFVADQASAGALPETATVTVTASPRSVTAAPGSIAQFTAAASGSPTPTVRWQARSTSGTWRDMPGATDLSVSVTVQAADAGTQYRAVFTNTLGWMASESATLTVSAPTDAPVVTATPTVSASAVTGPDRSSVLAATGSSSGLLAVATLVLLLVGTGLFLAARTSREG